MESLSPSPAKLFHLQMASLSPFPHLCFGECNFTGTLVSNLLLPSSRERQTCQSKSSGSRRLNRGNCCTQKFSLSFPQHFSHHKTLGAQDQVRVCSAQDSSLHCWPKLGFEFAQRCFDLKCPRWLSCFMLDSQVYPYQVSSLDSNLCPVNWTVDLKISCIGEKVNCGQLIVKPHDFWPTST